MELNGLRVKAEGQSVVEYLLLMLVVCVLAYSVLRSDAFVNLLGEDSEFFATLKRKQEYSFRHGVPLQDIPDYSTYNGDHHTYKNPASNSSRFFGPISEYP